MSEMAKESTGRAQQAGQTAKQEATATAGQAREGASQVVGTATDQVRAVTGEARAQAGAMAGDLRTRVTEEAESQTRRGAQVMRQWADDLSGLADSADADSPARSLVTQAADRGYRAADYLDTRGVGGLVDDLQDFARRRPGAFLGGAVVAGFAVGRLAKAGRKADGPGPDRSAQPRTSGSRSLPEDAAPPGLPGHGEV
ncbi:hypothetical protein [Streptomyces collinus]|uniref:Late embryogenesis abundant protein n=1 Tax=Streptomyces collinus TaxID=42684 RepID=A0AA89Q920_STRCU|nr:hypothetical protein [Streptomyces collinus]MBB5816607.1 hypothetical protein [Streptomyces collinus]WMX62120.1 hypothetical protein RFN52_01595 [Streptomyces collinus]